jgi:hypothetical protein
MYYYDLSFYEGKFLHEITNGVVELDTYKNCKKGKAIPVTGRRGPYGCGTLRLPNSLGNRFTDGREVVSLTRRQPLTPRKILGTNFS